MFGEFVAYRMLDASERDLMAIEPGSIQEEISFCDHPKQFDCSAIPDVEPSEIMSDKDECSCVEFKTSAFGSINTYQQNITANDNIFKKAESCYNIAKTICAFLNSEGGQLFIGVKEREEHTDSNQITGIESEFHKVSRLGNYSKTTDGYGRLIIDGIIKVFLPDFYPVYSKYLKIRCLEKDDHIVCRITVEPSREAVFILDYHYSSNGEDRFIVRNDFESQSLGIQDAVKYSLNHFCSKS